MNPSIVIPDRIKRLPRATNGYPTPFFVAEIDGVPDFRVACEGKRVRCFKENLCWICGERLEWWCAFAGGPLSMKNRHFSDGAMHVECAEFSMRVCPHILNPNAKKDDLADLHARPGRKPILAEHQSHDRPEYFAFCVTRLNKWHIERQGRYWFWALDQAPVAVRWWHRGKEIPDPYAIQLIVGRPAWPAKLNRCR
jgi:hypothetical protein